MHTWIIAVDRRRGNPELIAAELESLAQTVSGLDVSQDVEGLARAPDAGKFRDFAPLAVLSSEHERILAWVLEELVDTFGWAIDVTRLEVTP